VRTVLQISRCINPSAIGCWRTVRFLVLFHQNLTGKKKKQKASAVAGGGTVPCSRAMDPRWCADRSLSVAEHDVTRVGLARGLMAHCSRWPFELQLDGPLLSPCPLPRILQGYCLPSPLCRWRCETWAGLYSRTGGVKSCLDPSSEIVILGTDRYAALHSFRLLPLQHFTFTVLVRTPGHENDRSAPLFKLVK